ncbi:MAG TPA: type III pantothenate kinase [Spirochaetia bacterium]|nr:type III pantothenate kinase [Spirochaetia bacterium]
MSPHTRKLLCISVGNSSVAIGLFQGAELLHRWRLSTDKQRTSDEYGIAIRALLDLVAESPKQIDRVVLSSVVPSLAADFPTLIENALQRKPLVISSRLNLGLQIAIDSPQELGTDLIANAAAGHSRFPDNCIVVDFGTALSLTVVDRDGKIRGASIAPGMHAAMEALSKSTDQLPRVPLVPPPAAIGTNTVHSIQSGVVFGYIGLVEGLLSRMSAELSGRTVVVATGGLSGAIAPHIAAVDAIEPWLTLEGLRIIAELNPETV